MKKQKNDKGKNEHQMYQSSLNMINFRLDWYFLLNKNNLSLKLNKEIVNYMLYITVRLKKQSRERKS